MEIIIIENTMVKELINKQKLSLCHIGLVKDHGGHLVNQAHLKLVVKCQKTAVENEQA